MAFCLSCHGAMRQTETTCPHCGEAFHDPSPARSQLFLHRSSLRDLFRFSAVMALFFAAVPYLFAARESALVPCAIGLVCGFCGLLLGESGPFWSRVFSIVGLLGLLFYPLLVIAALSVWALHRALFFMF